ncbi:MAG: hypothetical protein IPO63_02985 [Bacteroidetes bacterium]|nr:hypothetical protein [Bacteroidota bacterium]
MKEYEKILAGGDLRSIGKSNFVTLKIQTQKDFDELFQYLFHENRIIVMRAADAIEKVTINNAQYLAKHKGEIIKLCNMAKDKELKWHLALIIPRLHLNNKEFGNAWNTLVNWAKDKTNSRIVRVNSIQGLFQLKQRDKVFEKEFNLILSEIINENIPSINARIRKLKNKDR